MKHLFALIVAVMVGLPCYAEAPREGRLLIIGGALDYDDPKIFHVFIGDAMRVSRETPIRIGVLPTASGEPERSGRLTAEDIVRHAKTYPLFERVGAEDPVDVRVIDVTTANPASAKDPSVVEQIDACDALWFTGGDQSRITAVFRPGDEDTPAYEAVLRVLERGGVVAGTSAGAAMMPERMIRWGNSVEALLVGRSDVAEDRGVGVGLGMGLLDGVMIDQHFMERRRLGRLIVAMHTEGIAMGIGVNENRALRVDLVSRVATPVGEEAVVVVRAFDKSTMAGSRYPGAISNGYRMSMLSDADRSVIDLDTGLIAARGADREASIEAVAPRFGAGFGKLSETGLGLVTWSDPVTRVMASSVIGLPVALTRKAVVADVDVERAERIRAEIEAEVEERGVAEPAHPRAWPGLTGDDDA
ncbi:cyanophycinase [Mucisphaera calidilacus]|uniref:Cyanophycinase n=1 Tax=Mucisphaera calidilacus TaxID=2527982 RepID=A0A518BU80_9BACT|nr:cyanophycinase [Mucisphaera calidilacus]QDU70563.1 Cyanophycinase precursor [Mucisphaera calidilacus]